MATLSGSRPARAHESLRDSLRHRVASLVVLLLVLAIASNLAAQEPSWRFRAGGGLLVSGGTRSRLDGGGDVRLGRTAPIVTFEVARLIDCCLEFFLTGLVPHIQTELTRGGQSTAAGKIAPTGFHLGMTYRLHRRSQPSTRPRSWFYVSPFVGVYTRDRSAAVVLPTTVGESGETVFRFPGGLGLGLGAGGRFRLNEQFALDANVRWHHLRIRIGNDARLLWHPFTISAGVVARLF